MKFITGKDRAQIPLFVSSLEEAIDQDNEAHLIELFVDSLQLSPIMVLKWILSKMVGLLTILPIWLKLIINTF